MCVGRVVVNRCERGEDSLAEGIVTAADERIRAGSQALCVGAPRLAGVVDIGDQGGRRIDTGRGAVVGDAVVGTSDDRVVVRRTAMGQRVVVVGKPVRVDQAVEERRVRAADDVVVALVLHVHHVHVIELADYRHRRRRIRRRGQVSADRERQVVGIGVVVARAGAEDPGVVIPKVERDLCVLGAHGEGSGGRPFPEAGLQPAVQCGDRTDAGAAEIGLISIEEINLH